MIFMTRKNNFWYAWPHQVWAQRRTNFEFIESTLWKPDINSAFYVSATTAQYCCTQSKSNILLLLTTATTYYHSKNHLQNNVLRFSCWSIYWTCWKNFVECYFFENVAYAAGFMFKSKSGWCQVNKRADDDNNTYAFEHQHGYIVCVPPKENLRRFALPACRLMVEPHCVINTGYSKANLNTKCFKHNRKSFPKYRK